jgi:hypothetical protein
MLYRVLLVSAETGAMWQQGGLSEQPEWFVDLLAWFLPHHDLFKFSSKAKMVLGEGDKHGNKKQR